MKKVYTVSGALLLAGGLMAQQGLSPVAKGAAPKYVTVKGSAYHPMQAKGLCLVSEDFEGGSIPAGWDIGAQVEIQNDQTGVGTGTFTDAWVVLDAAGANAGGYLPVPDAPANNKFAVAADDPDSCNCDFTDVGLVTPSIDFSGLVDMSVSLRAYSDDNFGGGPATVQVSTDGGTNYTTVYTVSAVENAWQSIVVDLSAYDGQPDVKIRFAWTDGGTGNWSTGFAVDDVCVAPILPNNLTVVQAFNSDVAADPADLAVNFIEYTRVPLQQAQPVSIGASVINNGGVDQTNVIITADVLFDGVAIPGSPFTSAAVPNSTSGQVDTLIIATGWTPTGPGDITFTVTASSDATEDFPGDNSGSKGYTITDDPASEQFSVWSVDDNSAASFGDGATAGDPYKIGNLFEVVNSGSMAYGIGVAFGTSDAGTIVTGELLDANLDLIESTEDYEINGGWDVNSTNGNFFAYLPFANPVPLDAESEVVATLNYFGGNSTVRYANSGVSVPQTSFFNDGTTWFYTTTTPMIRLYLAQGPVGVEELNNSGLTLGANVPNPFNENTVINYTLTDARTVGFEVFDVNGQVVYTENLGNVGSGNHSIEVDGTKLSAGVYSYTLTAGASKLTRSMVVVR